MGEGWQAMAREEHEEGRRNESAPPVKPHPKPPVSAPGSLNDAIRQELWYLDTVVSVPFRAIRRTIGRGHNPWSESIDEAVWALEGMTRLPLKILQSAFGEALQRGGPSPGANQRTEESS